MAAQDRACLRFAIAVALALALGYGFAVPLAFLAPLFAIFLGVAPGPPPGPRQLMLLVLVMLLSLAVGLLLTPLLIYYPVAGILLVFLGLYLANYVAMVAGKKVPGTFLIVGFTLISVAGTLSQGFAQTLIVSLAVNLVLAVVCLWLAYALIPEPPAASVGAEEPPESSGVSSWLALRAALVVMPAYLLALTNPSQYLMTIMKSVSLGQQASELELRDAGRELIGSTFVGGVMAVLFWSLLKLMPNLWMFTLWMGAFALFTAVKIYRLRPSRHAASFWVNALVTMLILLGPAVQDSANGNDALTGFLIRFTTFIGVTLYAWFAVAVLEHWRRKRLNPDTAGA